ncbi:YkgJ family cysteine cluster protein [Flavobacterium ovatum]|uniref:YkgJ family cysteine cluster protein n=1 Tax=Flavobacterium ovatum TaxID=1928857 RepID=UPI0034508B9F
MESKVKLVEQLFARLESEITTFKSETKIQCSSGCGKCCTTPNIDASPLEFLPWALHLFIEGKAESTLEAISTKTDSSCFLYQPNSISDNINGTCSDYHYRGLICRLFGYAGTKDKNGKSSIVTCSLIKENQQENYNNALEAINKGLYIPLFTDYYMQLFQIDNRLAVIKVPINQAFKIAIEEVLHYYAYRPFLGDLKTPA